jgi:hypothetical protein
MARIDGSAPTILDLQTVRLSELRRNELTP